MTPTRGRRLGIDVGAVRVGVAMCDPDGILATPVETVPRDAEGGADVRRIAALVAEHDVVGVVLGLPRNLRGEDGPAAVAAREFAAALEAGLAAAGCAVPVELTDERMTTVVATRQLAGRGVRGRKQRAVIDQQAAVAILQGWLDTTRGT
ncbi:Holliday junction resolvase RuvX [Pseudonocardia sp. TMWB2A]|uniref:Holliday junction resolvase RuvX n=1 Tax=Pseudonocardia TaxID=1847 RepID=UPI001AD60877|nr:MULTISPECIES: Holliday junction resolvase RuvX [Pseudonocardia]MBO4241482.1 Holliday junction resolvase RuvX [Pseudonocardia alni]